MAFPLCVQADEFDEDPAESQESAEVIRQDLPNEEPLSAILSSSSSECSGFDDPEAHPDSWKVQSGVRDGARFELEISYHNPQTRAVIHLAVPEWYRILNPRTGYAYLDGQYAATIRRRDHSMVVLLSEYGQQQLCKGRELKFTLSLEALHPDQISYINIGWNTVLYDPQSEEIPAGETLLSGGLRLQNNSFQFTSREEITQRLEGGCTQKVSQLKHSFPAGKYWNHPVGRADYSVESVSDQPCSHEDGGKTSGYTCNVFDNGAQCAGFAFLCFNKFHGFACHMDTLHAQRIAGGQGVSVGDVIHEEGHFSFVTEVLEDGFIVMEANAENPCQISHGRKVPVSSVLDFYTPKKEYTIVFDSNGREGTMDIQTVPSQELVKVSSCKFFSQGYDFAGWVVFNQSRNQILYQNDEDPMDFEYASSRQSAKKLGCSRPAVLTNNHQIQALAEPGETLIFKAVWVRSTASTPAA